MENKISKAQLEVWEWKELLYDEIKDLHKEKRIEYILKKVTKTIEALSKKKNTAKEH